MSSVKDAAPVTEMASKNLAVDPFCYRQFAEKSESEGTGLSSYGLRAVSGVCSTPLDDCGYSSQFSA